MRFLKKKIALSAQAHPPTGSNFAEGHSSVAIDNVKLEVQLEAPSGTFDRPSKPVASRGRKRKENGQPIDEIKSTKTVVKNYGKAIASFALSPIAIPYLNPMLKQEGIKLNEFIHYISAVKESIEGIDTFRALLLIKDSDEKKTASSKRIFQSVGEIFIKYFSVNWIYSGRMMNKKAHLKFRFKMLRRIKNPELFTYLK